MFQNAEMWKKSNHINVKDTNCDDSKYKVYFICTEIFSCNIPQNENSLLTCISKKK